MQWCREDPCIKPTSENIISCPRLFPLESVEKAIGMTMGEMVLPIFVLKYVLNNDETQLGAYLSKFVVGLLATFTSEAAKVLGLDALDPTRIKNLTSRSLEWAGP